MNFLNTIKLIASLLPTIIDLVKVLEANVKGSGKGSVKLETLRAMLEAVYEIAPGGVTFEALWPAVSRVVASVVALFNATGWKHD